MEIAIISFEVIVLSMSLYLFFQNKGTQLTTMIQYGVYGLHLLTAILFLLFMSFFKINRLI